MVKKFSCNDVYQEILALVKREEWKLTVDSLNCSGERVICLEGFFITIPKSKEYYYRQSKARGTKILIEGEFFAGSDSVERLQEFAIVVGKVKGLFGGMRELGFGLSTSVRDISGKLGISLFVE